MTPERWRAIEALYHAARDCGPVRRAQLLAGADPDVRREVESLLAQPRGEGPLDGCAVDLLPDAGSAPPDADADADAATRAGSGLVFGPYLVLSTLGRGGMGVVYRARDTKLDRDVAIKVLPEAFRSDPQRLARFQREAKTLAALNHPNIAAIYGLEERDGTTALVLELVEGPTLADRIARGPCPIGEALALAAQIAEALRAAHERGVIHRDLKPANIKLRADGAVKVLDFGLAKRPAEGEGDDAATAAEVITRPELTRDGVILGTVGYMSPEQAAGRSADFAADQFSFGVILFELLCGKRPFAGDSSVETLSAIICNDPPSMAALNPAVPAPLQAVVERCLAKKPRDRYPSTQEMVEALRQVREPAGSAPHLRAPAGAGVAPSGPRPALHRLSRRPSVWIAAAIVLAIASGGAAWRLWAADPGIRFVAVLPFANAAADPDIEYLCDGLTETLTQQIARLPSLRVMASSTVFNFKGKPINPREVGRQLGVDAILTGTVTRREGRLRVTAELVDVATGAQLWGNTYDRTAAEVIAVQDQLAAAIIDQGLRLRISSSERVALGRHLTDHPEAFEFYLRARHAVFRGTEEDFLEARDLLNRAIERDPRFAMAYRALAATYVNTALDGFERPTEAFPKASELLKRSLTIDPEALENSSVSAGIAFFYDWDWATADRKWAIATSAPNPLPTQEWVGRSFVRWVLAGPEDALRVVRQLRELDGVTPSYAVLEADYLFHAGRLDESARLYEQTIARVPTPGALFGLAEVRHAQRRFDEALETRRQAHELAGDDAMLELFEGARGEDGYRRIDRAFVELELKALREREASGYVSPLDFARAYAQLGDREQAFVYLDKAFVDRSPGLVLLKVDRAWDPIRGDPRFAASVRKVNLP